MSKNLGHILLFFIVILLCGSFASAAYAAILDVTNAQKLSLATTTSIGQVVRISDAFYVTGAGNTEMNGLYTLRGTADGKPFYNLAGTPDDTNADSVNWEASGSHWVFRNIDTSYVYISTQDVAYPWLVTNWGPNGGIGPLPLPTLTHPALQQLRAASTSVTAVLINGSGSSDANGVYTQRTISDGKPFYVLLGYGDEDQFFVGWRDVGFGIKWVIVSNGAVQYYSNDNVAFPWLVTTWIGADDDSTNAYGQLPFPATTSYTFGQVNAGVTVAGAGTAAVNGVWVISGGNLGRSAYYQAGNPTPLQWDSVQWNMTGDMYLNSDDVAFPWAATSLWTTSAGDNPPPMVYRNDVASEANWAIYTEPPPPPPPPSIGGGSAENIARLAAGNSYVLPSSTPTPVPTDTPTPTPSATPTPSVAPTLVPLPPVILPEAPVFTHTLSWGNNDSEVKLLQKFLNSHGFIIAKSGPGSPSHETTYFGTLTQRALMRFQRANGIKPVNGILGPLTRAAINGQ